MREVMREGDHEGTHFVVQINSNQIKFKVSVHDGNHLQN